MADDWVKMRILLESDPRVIAIASRLLTMKPFLDWLGCAGDCVRTQALRDLVEAKVATSLRRVWGVTRRDGTCDGDDYVLECSTLDTLDRVAEVPGFGEAMASVGWAIVEPAETIRFPKLVPYLTSPAEIAREKANERKRQQRQRDKQGRDAGMDGGRDAGVTGHAEVTHRLDEIREEKKEENTDPPTPKGGEGVSIPPQNESAPEKPKKAKKSPPTEWDGKLPPELDEPDFRELWTRWEKHRKDKHASLTPDTREFQWKKLIGWGMAKALASVEQSICQGWQGLFEPKTETAGKATSRHDPDERRKARHARIEAIHKEMGIS